MDAPVSNYETGFTSAKPRESGKKTDQSLADELDLLSLSFEPTEQHGKRASGDTDNTSPDGNRRGMFVRDRAAAGRYPTGLTAKQRCYNCGQIGHISFDCQQPQVRKACYTCGNSGHLARDCPQGQRPIICYVCRQPGHLASKCPTAVNGQQRNRSTGATGGHEAGQ